MSAEVSPSSIAAIIWTDGDVPAFEPTLRALHASHPDLEIVVGYRDERPDLAFDSGAILEQAYSLSGLVLRVSRGWTRHILLVTGPVLSPDDLLCTALPAVEEDLRIGTVSFLSNAAGYLSVPNRNQPSSHQIGPRDEDEVTSLLRTSNPRGTMVPVPVPAGALTLLSRFALATVDGLLDLPATPSFIVAEFALRAAARGFLSMADSSTFVSYATDIQPYCVEPIDDMDSNERHALVARHGWVMEVYEAAKHSEDSPIGLAVKVAAAKVRGLRIIIDGSEIGPTEMGTQVQILSLVRELAARRDVDQIQLALPGRIPGYAERFIRSSKITVFYAQNLDFSAATYADVVHRPAQPSSSIPFDNWRSRGSRVVLTLQDLVAYQIGSYFPNAAAWQKYRTDLTTASRSADGVVMISHDTLRHVQREALPIESGRMFVIENGTDHLDGSEAVTMPTELVRRGFLGEEFLLVLGTNYGHKNRDLAIRAWMLLQYSYPQLHLILVGAQVPYGSSRLAETRADVSKSSLLHVLPDVTSEERNWLLRHARAVVYATSAEGFGLVPFEAAKFGTPSIGVSFGPLAEVNPELPVVAESWRPEDLSAAVGRVLSDPALASEQVQKALSNGTRYAWSRTAAGLVDAYRRTLSLPALSSTPR